MSQALGTVSTAVAPGDSCAGCMPGDDYEPVQGASLDKRVLGALCAD